jgi:FlaA1/EpsC-like NDP-sugar epimerase
MHEPIKIVDLAKKMIHLMGYDVKDENSYRGDIAIEYTGLRPGEKLYEELLIGESVTGTDHPKILRAEEEFLPWESLQSLIERMQTASQELDLKAVRDILIEAVNGFEPGEQVSDPLWEMAEQTLDQTTAPAPGKVTKLFKE